MYNITFVDVEEYFSTCPWMNDLYGWKNGWNLYWMLPTNVNFVENWTKKKGVKQFMLVSFKPNPKKMFKSQSKAILHFIFNRKYIQVLQHLI
jgi:hypothetical protein